MHTIEHLSANPKRPPQHTIIATKQPMRYIFAYCTLFTFIYNIYTFLPDSFQPVKNSFPNSNLGKMCPLLLKTTFSSGKKSSDPNKRYRYLNASA